MTQTFEELDAATVALFRWFKSQDLMPADAVMVLNFAIARIVAEMVQSQADQNTQLDLMREGIQVFVDLMKAMKAAAK
jgi:hypothetical protein